MLAICARRSTQVIVAVIHAPTLRGADLSGVALAQASLHGFDLSGARLTGANLRGADLSRADLRGVDLSGAVLEGALLTDAVYDVHTHWPDGFDPITCGAVLEGRRRAPASGDTGEVQARLRALRMRSREVRDASDCVRGRSQQLHDWARHVLAESSRIMRRLETEIAPVDHK